MSKVKPTFTADHWILHCLHETAESIEGLMAKYELGKAYEKLYHFIWDDFADWYLETSKVQYNPEVLVYVLETILKLAHPFAPYVTETIWDTLDWEDSLLINADWPKPKDGNKKEAADFVEIQKMVREIRHIRTQLQMDKNTLYHKDSDFLETNKELLIKLTGLKDVKKVASGKGLHLTSTTHDCWVDIAAQKAHDYVIKLIKKREAHKKTIANLEGRLANENYTKNAPKKIIEETKQQLADEKILLERIGNEVETFERAMKQL